MPSILKRMSSGFAGAITRPDNTTVESAYMVAATPVTAFGAPVKMVAGKIVPFAGGETSASYFGSLVQASPNITNIDGSPVATQIHGVAIRGYVNVLCTVGTPVRNGIVYVRIVTAGANVIGNYEATADGVNNVAITSLAWAVDGKDASNVTELKIK